MSETTKEPKGWRDDMLREVQSAVYVATGEGQCPRFDLVGAVGSLFDDIDTLTRQLAEAQARAEKAETDCAAERQRAAQYEVRIIEATGVEVPPGGMSALDAVTALTAERDTASIDELKAENARLTRNVGALAGFVARGIDDHCAARWWRDADLQDHLLAHGLLALVSVEAVGECGSNECACEPGDMCARVTPLGQQIRRIAETVPTPDAGGGDA